MIRRYFWLLAVFNKTYPQITCYFLEWLFQTNVLKIWTLFYWLKYQQMNNFTASHRHLNQKEPILIHISDIANQSQQKKLCLTSQSSQKDINPRKMDLSRPQLQQFPDIFTKRKREEYSGYKQYNLNKSKLVCLGQPRRQKQPKYPSRKYEVNLKNIIKLKKRFSLQPTHFKSLYKEQRITIRDKQILQNSQEETANNRTSQQLNLRQLMKNILLHHNLQRRIPAYFSNHAGQCTSERQYQQNTNEFQRYKSQLQYLTSQSGIKNKLQKQQKCYKVSLENYIRKSKKKSKIFFKTEENPKCNNNEIERQLCGWQNKTIYGIKNKSVLQQKLIHHKTEFQQDP